MSDYYHTSPDRYEFLRSVRHQSFLAGQITESQLEEWNTYFDKCRKDDADPDYHDQPSLEIDLRYSSSISFKCKASESYSQNLYAALCQNQFIKHGKLWSCSWRQAGGIVANLREEGDYINWYCSGINAETPFVAEGKVADEIEKDILDLGWVIERIEDEIN